MIRFFCFLILILTLTLNNLVTALEKKPYHHLPDGTFRNPEGSPKRDPNIKWSYKIFNEERKKIFKSYQVNMNLMSKAKKDAIFLHCLPAHRGEEIDDIILDSDYSAVWQQAHNRLYSSMALIEFLLSDHD